MAVADDANAVRLAYQQRLDAIRAQRDDLSDAALVRLLAQAYLDARQLMATIEANALGERVRKVKK